MSTILLGLLFGILYIEEVNRDWTYFYKVTAVPDVELVNSFSLNSKGVVDGDVVGFVAFDNKEKQPKSSRQYIKISALNNFDKNKNQLFLLTDIIKMPYLAPRYFDPVTINAINYSGDLITLSDNQNNQYFINKKTGEVSMFDETKDVARLITSDIYFKDYMKELLK